MNNNYDLTSDTGNTYSFLAFRTNSYFDSEINIMDFKNEVR